MKIDLSSFINGANIGAADLPHTVVEKLQAAIDRATPPSPSTAPNPADLRSAAKLIRQSLLEAPGTAMWIDCDQARACEDAADYIERLSPSTASEVGELPPLPEAAFHTQHGYVYFADQMRDYGQACARAALAAKMAGSASIDGQLTGTPSPVKQASTGSAIAFPPSAAAREASRDLASRLNTIFFPPSTGEVDVEAERGLPARIQAALDLLADAKLPSSTWRDVSNVLHACRDALAARLTQTEGARDA